MFAMNPNTVSAVDRSLKPFLEFRTFPNVWLYCNDKDIRNFVLPTVMYSYMPLSATLCEFSHDCFMLPLSLHSRRQICHKDRVGRSTVFHTTTAPIDSLRERLSHTPREV